MLKNTRLQDNIKLFYISTIFRSGNFWIPVWIAIYNEVLTINQIGYFWAINFFVVGLLEIPTGIIADIIGRKWACAIGSAIMMIAFFVIGFNPTVTGILIYSILSGLGEAFVSGTRSVLLYDTMKQLNRESEYAKIQTYGLLIFEGLMAVFTVLGGWIYSQGFERAPFILRAIFWGISVPIFVAMVEPVFSSKKQTFKNFGSILRKSIQDLVKHRKIIKLSVLYIFTFGISAAVVRFMMQPILLDFGFIDAQTRSLVTAALKLWIAITALLIAKMYKNRLPNIYLLVIPLIMVIIYIPVKYIPLPWAVLLLFPIALPGNARDIFLSPFVKKYLKPDFRATSMSILNSLGMIVFGFVNMFYGFVGREDTSINYIFILGIISLTFLLPLSINLYLQESTKK